MGFNRMQAIGQLNRILTYGRISPWLRRAVADILKALKVGHYGLAADLTGVKSLVSGAPGASMDQLRTSPRVGPFYEDVTFNEQVLGTQVYSVLDHMHAELAWMEGRMPSGMMSIGVVRRPTYGTPGLVEVGERGESHRRHPVLRKIEEERERIRREAQARHGGGDQLMRGY